MFLIMYYILNSESVIILNRRRFPKGDSMTFSELSVSFNSNYMHVNKINIHRRYRIAFTLIPIIFAVG